jgi:hypothetical protein
MKNDICFNVLLKTFPLPENIENFSQRNKNLVMKFLNKNFSNIEIVQICNKMQKFVHILKEENILFETSFRNIIDLIFNYAFEYCAALDKISFTKDKGYIFKLMNPNIFTSECQNILKMIWLNFIIEFLEAFKNELPENNIIFIGFFQKFCISYIENYYNFITLQKYEIDLKTEFNKLKDEIYMQIFAYQHKRKEEQIMTLRPNYFLVSYEG